MNLDSDDELDEIYRGPVKKVVGFKKKSAKVKNTRSTLVTDELDEQLEDIQITQLGRRKPFKSVSQPKKKEVRDLSLELGDDPDSMPVIENLEEFQEVESYMDKFTVEPVQEPEPKYVPIASDVEFNPQTKRRMLSSYANEYVDEYNNKDDEEYQKEAALDKDKMDIEMEITNEDFMAEDEPLNLKPSSSVLLNKAKYDLEILSEEEDQEINMERPVSAKATRLLKTLTMEEQVDKLNSTIEQLQISKSRNEAVVESCEDKLRSIQQQRQELVSQLSQ